MKVFGLWERLTKIIFFKGKQVAIEPATQSGAADKTISIPDMASNASQEMVLSDQAQTLANKTLTSPVVSGNAVTPGAGKINLSASANQLQIAGENGRLASISTASLSGAKTFVLPDNSGNIVTTGDTGSITSTMIADGTIVNADINASAAIDGSKIVSASASVPGVVTTGAQTFAGVKTFSADLTLSSNGFLKIPTGTAAQQPGQAGQPAAATGMIRYNTTQNSFEGYDGSIWAGLGGGGTTDRITQANSFNIGDVVYLNGSTYTAAIATAANTAEVAGVVSKIVTSGSVFEITLVGEVTGILAARFDEGTLPATGEAVFLSPTEPGKLTITEPSVVGQVSVPVGIVSGSGSLYVQPKRGVVVGGANLRTQIGLANNATTTIQNASAYDAGELSGWVYIDATTDYRFYVQAQFAKKGAAVTDYDLAYQTVGDTPPAGFNITVTAAGLIQVVVPNIAGFNSATSNINFALNAPAVGATLPLQIDSANVSFTDIKAASSAGITFKEDGGTTVGSVSDAGAWTLGPSNTANTNQINGVLRVQSSSTTGGLRFAQSSSTSYIQTIGTDTSTNGRLQLYSYRSDFSNEILTGDVSSAGAWTLGPSSGLTGAHTFQSSATIANQMTTFLKTAVTINQNNNIYSLYASSNGTDGYIQTNGSAVLTIVDASDMRRKENIRNASYGLSTIKSLRPVEFDWKSGIKNVKGFIAQEVKEVLPESVSIKDESENGGLSDMHYLETQTMIPVLVKAIQEQQAQIEELKAKLAALETK